MEAVALSLVSEQKEALFLFSALFALLRAPSGLFGHVQNKKGTYYTEPLYRPWSLH